MRIISGKLKGFVIKSPHSQSIHPMSEKIRGAIFAVLGDISTLEVLDVYSGSGAIALEAYSRGASLVTALDSQKQAMAALKSIVNSLKIGSNIRIVNQKVETWAPTNLLLYDVIIADPPYDKTNEEILTVLADKLKPSGILVLSWPGNMKVPSLDNLKVIKSKRYGDAQLIFYNY